MKRGAAKVGRILIVDGYNVINVRKPVRESAGLEDARRQLIERLHDYAGYSGQRIVLVLLKSVIMMFQYFICYHKRRIGI